MIKGLPKDWESVRKMLADPGFTRTLLDFDKDHIPVENIARLKAYINNPNFTPEAVGKQSKAAQGLCMWVRAMFSYDSALQVGVWLLLILLAAQACCRLGLPLATG